MRQRESVLYARKKAIIFAKEKQSGHVFALYLYAICLALRFDFLCKLV